MDLEDFGRQLRGHVLSGTGLTIGVGFGATKHWPNRRSGRQRNGHNSVGAGAVARKSTQNGKITQPAAGGRNLGRWEPDSEKAARYGDHHCPAAVADEPYIYPENFNVVLERTVRELNGETAFRWRKRRRRNSRLSAVAASGSGSPPTKKCAGPSASMPSARRKSCAVSDSTAGISAPSSRHPLCG